MLKQQQQHRFMPWESFEGNLCISHIFKMINIQQYTLIWKRGQLQQLHMETTQI